MTNELEEIKEWAAQLLREGYLEALVSPADIASMEHVAPKLGLDPENWEDKREFRRLAQYLSGKRLIESYADGFGLFRITSEGRAWVESQAAQQAPTTQMPFHGTVNAYGSAIGAQENVESNVSFDMGTAAAQLDQAEAEADRLGGPDADQIKELLAELREHLDSGEPIEAGKLAKYGDLPSKHAWLLGPVVSTLLNFAFETGSR
jgi:hypothetical protein